jgi:hypothetical protein
MNTTLLLLFMLLGCDDSPRDELHDDWHLYQPDFIFDPPLGREITWSAPSSMADELQKAADEWTLHLSCGLKLTQVEEGGDLQFRCADAQRKSYFHPDEMGWEYYGLVSIDEHYCENLPPLFALHAWSHQLGFAEDFSSNSNVQNPGGIALITYGMKSYTWHPTETDGLRIWAHQNGAPGCGNKELPWSWQKDPKIYRSHPTRAEANEMLEPLQK